MGKFNLHRGSLQLRVLTLTLLFTLGVSIVITVSNMHQLNAEWERTTLLNAEYTEMPYLLLAPWHWGTRFTFVRQATFAAFTGVPGV